METNIFLYDIIKNKYKYKEMENHIYDRTKKFAFIVDL
jgi:hypothetical protein